MGHLLSSGDYGKGDKPKPEEKVDLLIDDVHLWIIANKENIGNIGLRALSGLTKDKNLVVRWCRLHELQVWLILFA